MATIAMHQDEERERDDDVDDATDEGVRPTREVRRDETDDDADDHREDHADEPDQQVGPGGEDHAREDVAAELVGAEPVRRGSAAGARRRGPSAVGSYGVRHGAKIASQDR